MSGSSFIIIGFEPEIWKVKQKLKEIINLGVIPLITPAKFIPGVKIQISQINTEEFLDLIKFAAKECKQNGVNPTKHKAGCIRCGGCSPLIDAYQIY